nr:reverse transcriptase domain-containing protein [Tanacetum cinerariifolium]
MTNKIDIFLNVINDRMTGALPSDTVRNSKLMVNLTSSVLSARSYPTGDLKVHPPEWSRHVTIIHQTKDLHTADYTQLYDFLKYNQKENVKNQVAQNQRVQNVGNQNGLIGVPGNANQNGNGNLVAAHAEGNAAGHNRNQIRCYNCRGVADLDEIEEVNANCILMANLQQASTSGTQTDKASVYDTDGSAEEATKFVGDFKSLAKEADESLAKQKALELEIERLLRAVNTIYENAKLRAQLFKKVSVQKDNTCGTSKNTKLAKQSILGKPPMLGEIHALSKLVTSNSVSTPQESKVVNNDKVIAPRMFRINPFKTSREEKHVPNNVRTRRPQPRSNTKNDKVPSESKSSRSKNKEAEVEEHHRNLLLSKNNKHMSSACNNFKLDSQNVISKVICAMSKKSSSLVESNIQTNATIADDRTMAQMLQAPIEGYENAIVVPPINANNFEIKQTLINLVQSNQFTGRQDPHNHLRFFNKVTSTFRHPEVSNTTVKLLLFLFSLEGEARIWLDKEPPRSILTWEDLDALDSAAGGNFLDKIPRECLSIIESKSKVRYSRSRVIDVRTNANANLSNSQSNSFDFQQIAAALEDKLDIRMNRFEKSLIDMK